jgi:hypothetical protein
LAERFGTMDVGDTKRLKTLEAENNRTVLPKSVRADSSGPVSHVLRINQGPKDAECVNWRRSIRVTVTAAFEYFWGATDFA